MPREYSLQQIAEHIDAELKGGNDDRIVGLNTLQDATTGQLSFLSNPSYRKLLASTAASAVIMSPSMANDFSGAALILDDPYLGYAKASALFDDTPVTKMGVHPSAIIASTADIHSDACIGPNVVIGENVIVGANTMIGAGCSISDHSRLGANGWLAANVTICHNVTIGENVRIHSGAVLGADGFGFAPEAGQWRKIYQLGGVVIGNNVEIGACTTIDRGALGDTVIEDGVILDNHVMIAHNVRVGENTAMAGYAAAAGSAVIGKNCIFAGRAGVAGHVTLCDGVQLTTQTVISRSITEPGAYSSGTQVSKSAEWRKNAVRFNQLNDMANRLRKLEKNK